MTREEILKQITDIFKDVLDNDSISLSDSTTANDIDGWDSLSHISLMSAIGKNFNIRFSMKEILGFHNVGELVDNIMNRT